MRELILKETNTATLQNRLEVLRRLEAHVPTTWRGAIQAEIEAIKRELEERNETEK